MRKIKKHHNFYHTKIKRSSFPLEMKSQSYTTAKKPRKQTGFGPFCKKAPKSSRSRKYQQHPKISQQSKTSFSFKKLLKLRKFRKTPKILDTPKKSPKTSFFSIKKKSKNR
jgi:hypothetical protein